MQMPTPLPMRMLTEEDKLAGEQARLERSGRLHGAHWAVVAGSLLITLFAWHLSNTALDERVASRFDSESVRIVNLFTEQLQRHADVLQATAGFMTARDGIISTREWRRYTQSLDLPTLYPALDGFGIVYHVRETQLADFLAFQRETRPEYKIFPPHDQPFYMPLVHVAPLGFEALALGVDSARDPARREAIERAMTTGKASISSPVNLTAIESTGFLMYVPFHRADAEERMLTGPGGMSGVVVAAVVPENVTGGLRDRDDMLVQVRISDERSVLYDEHDDVPGESSANTNDGASKLPLLTRSIKVPVFGRRWRFDIETTDAFSRDTGSLEPGLILTGGLFIDALLLSLFVMMTRARRDALSFADRTAGRLRVKSEALEETNRQLESFAYVVSHDLKAPLRGISDLVSFLEEDLETYITSDDANPDVARNFARIHRQTDRAGALIGGILAYSRLGSKGLEVESVNTRELIMQIADGLGVNDQRLVIQGDLPVLTTCRTRLDQVLANLIGNAFKYHHDPDDAQVIVRVTPEEQDRYRFEVQDDGPGIEARHHEKIFDLFSTLQSRDTIESTGVGLSIVKKTVALMGGTITLDSTPGKGSTFAFDWPAQ